jgi:hypothetical protein
MTRDFSESMIAGFCYRKTIDAYGATGATAIVKSNSYRRMLLIIERGFAFTISL